MRGRGRVLESVLVKTYQVSATRVEGHFSHTPFSPQCKTYQLLVPDWWSTDRVRWRWNSVRGRATDWV